jgi:hypothetical protein
LAEDEPAPAVGAPVADEAEPVADEAEPVADEAAPDDDEAALDDDEATPAAERSGSVTSMYTAPADPGAASITAAAVHFAPSRVASPK